MPPSERERYNRQNALARNAVGENAFAASRAQGRAMTLNQAVEYVMETANF